MTRRSAQEQRAPGSSGAYGLEIRGAAGAARLLVEARAGWPPLRIIRRSGPVAASPDVFGVSHAELRVRGGGGRIRIDRKPSRAVFTTPTRVSDDAFAHPYLAPVAAVVAYWLGRPSFHGGGVVVNGGVWGVLGERDAGKSSTLAWLARAGYGVVSDDLLVLEGTTVFAGPRAVDLRADPARELGGCVELGFVGQRERWRLPLDGIASELPLRGWVYLGWGDRVEAVPIPVSERLQRLDPMMSLRLPFVRPSLLLELVSLPTWELRRPRRWDSISEAADSLVQLADSR